MADKYFISAQELLEDSYRLGAQIIESDFRPDFIVGIWRGGAPVGIAVQEMLEHFDVSTDHISVRTSLYTGINTTERQVRVHGLDYLVKNLDAENALLIVDDVFDSGRSVAALIKAIRRHSRLNAPGDIRVACPWYKPGKNAVGFEPEYFLHESEDWLVFPHELDGLDKDEIARGKPDLARILDLFE